MKRGSSLREKSQVKAIYESIANEKVGVIAIDLYVIAIVNLCDLLLLELRMFENEDALEKVNKYLNNILKIAKKQHSNSLLVQIYILQSKMELLQLNIEKAQALLSQAHIIAIEKKLLQVAIKANNESDNLKKQKKHWEQLNKSNISLQERFELSNIDETLKTIIKRKEADISDLAESAVDFICVSFFKMGITGPE